MSADLSAEKKRSEELVRGAREQLKAASPAIAGCIEQCLARHQHCVEQCDKIEDEDARWACLQNCNRGTESYLRNCR